MADPPTDPPTHWVEWNKKMWDERVPIHLRSEFYDVEGFKAGEPRVEPFEVDELGALGGLELVHLQCHFGLDTLDLVRIHPNLTAVGLDFSEPAIDAATKLASDMELADRASFVYADVHDAARILGPGSFDVVYTGKGALNWLPDLRAWAEQCAALLRPGGELYLCEFHEVGYTLGQDAPVVEHDYFQSDTIIEEDVGTYADLEAPRVHNLSYEWRHPTADVLTSLLGVGFRLLFFHEWDYTLFKLNNWLVEDRHGRFHWPGPGRLPLMYSLKAQKPEPPTSGTR